MHLRYYSVLMAALLGTSAFAATFHQPDATALPDLFKWTDTCNVWVLRSGDAALLINLGDGSVLEHLADFGVKQVDWVLFTDHHREQCQGAPKLDVWRTRGTKAPRSPRGGRLFRKPAGFSQRGRQPRRPFSVSRARFGASADPVHSP